MMTQLRYNLKIVMPTLLWTGILSIALTILVLLGHFSLDKFDVPVASGAAEQFIPLIAAFFMAGVLDVEMKRGAHEVICSKHRPLWQTLSYRIVVTLLLALCLGAVMMLIEHFFLKPLPVGMLLLVAIPPALCTGLISLWLRIRLGNAFIGYVAAIVFWLINLVVGMTQSGPAGLDLNPLFNPNSYTQRLQAIAASAVESTPYVDWWWVNKLALVLLSVVIYWSITRRVEQLVEAD
jgi:hypothetical protein